PSRGRRAGVTSRVRRCGHAVAGPWAQSHRRRAPAPIEAVGGGPGLSPLAGAPRCAYPRGDPTSEGEMAAGANPALPRRGRSGPYRDRTEAGRELAALLEHHRGEDTIVLGLPRGGVPVAAEVAHVLGAPLDVLVVRKLGVPRQPELAMGAVAGVGGRVEVVRNDAVIDEVGVGPEAFERVLREEVAEPHRRQTLYRGNRPPPEAAGRTVVVVDDGLATGSTMRAALTALRRQGPARLVVAVP